MHSENKWPSQGGRKFHGSKKIISFNTKFHSYINLFSLNKCTPHSRIKELPIFKTVLLYLINKI